MLNVLGTICAPTDNGLFMQDSSEISQEIALDMDTKTLTTHQATAQQTLPSGPACTRYHLCFSHAAKAGEEADKHGGLHQDGQDAFHRMAIVPLPDAGQLLLVLFHGLGILVLQ